MSSEDEAKAAIEKLNGSDLKGRKINVNEARPQENRE
jgi:RNA recognition motif-containing protein